MNEPRGLALDAAGNLYIADRGNNRRIRKLSTSGVITTMAGGGPPDCLTGPCGDGEDALSATQAQPYGLATSPDGLALYIADTGHHRVRRVFFATGRIHGFAGVGLEGYSGDGFDPTLATMRSPHSVAIEADGDVLISDSSNHVVRREDLTANIINTVVGTGCASSSCGFVDNTSATSGTLDGQAGIALDPAGNLFIADTRKWLVRKVRAPSKQEKRTVALRCRNFTGRCRIPVPMMRKFFLLLVVISGALLAHAAGATPGYIYPYAGNGGYGFAGDGGLAVNARIDGPLDVVLDTSGNAFIADAGNDRVRKVDPSGIITTFAGNGCHQYSGCDLGDGGQATSARIYSPTDIALAADGSIYIGEGGGYRVRKVDTSGTITTVAGTGVEGYSGDGGPATQAQLGSVVGMAFDSLGNLYLALPKENRVRKIDPSGIITTYAGTGKGAGTAYRGFSGDGGPAARAELAHPFDVAVDESDNLFISDLSNNRVRKVDAATGIITTYAGGGPADAVRDTCFPWIEGRCMSTMWAPGVDGIPATLTTLQYPSGLAFDASGDLYIADGGHHSVRRVDSTTGIIYTVAGSQSTSFIYLFNSPNLNVPALTPGTLSGLHAIDFDAKGNLYVAVSSPYNRVLMVEGPMLGIN